VNCERRLKLSTRLFMREVLSTGLGSPVLRQARRPAATRLQRFLPLCCHHPYVGFMAVEPDQLHELPPPTPAPAELCERAAALVRSHPECFWFRHPEARSAIWQTSAWWWNISANMATAALGGTPRTYTNATHRFTKRHPSSSWLWLYYGGRFGPRNHRFWSARTGSCHDPKLTQGSSFVVTLDSGAESIQDLQFSSP